MNSSLGKGALYLSISSFVLMFSGYIVNIFIGRNLGPENYGIYGIVISLITTINLMQTSSLPVAVSKFIAEDESKKDIIMKSGLVIQLISGFMLTILFYFLAKPLSFLLQDIQLVPLIQLASLIFPSYGIFALYTGYYNGLHDFKRQAYLNSVLASVKLIVVLGFVYLFQLLGAIIGFAISPFIALLSGLYFPKKVKSHFPYRKLIFFSLPLIGLAIFSNLLQSVDLFFIKAIMHSDVAPGFYTASQNISRIPFFAFTSLTAVLLPSISRSVSQNLESETRRLIEKTLRIIILLCTPTIIIMSATSNELIDLVYSTEYLPAAESLSILLIGIAFLTIFIVQSHILNGAGKPKAPLIISFVGVLSTIIFCIYLIPSLGLSGAALATTFGSFIAMMLVSFFVYRRFKVLVPIKNIIKIVVSSSVIHLLAKIIILPTFFLPILYLLLFAIYILILIILKEITKEDFILVKSLLPDMVRRKLKI